MSPPERSTQPRASGWSVLLAYKGGAGAKSRLAAQLGAMTHVASAGERISLRGHEASPASHDVSPQSPEPLNSQSAEAMASQLAEAMARDTMQAVLDSGAVRRLTIVCGSAATARQARRWLRELSRRGAHREGRDAHREGRGPHREGQGPHREGQGAYLRTVVQPDHVRGLNGALSWARGAPTTRDAAVSLAALLGDLPALRAGDVVAALERAREEFARGADQIFVPDAHGDGTVLLAARRPYELTPRFGPHSAEAHERVGAVRCELARPTLRTDVDRLADLRAALRLGAGAHTTALLGDTTAL